MKTNSRAVVWKGLSAIAICLTCFYSASVLAQFTLGAATRVSNPSGGGVANGNSGSPAQSANSSFLVFASTADNLDPNDANGRQSDVFIKDLDKGSLFPISVDDNSSFGNGASQAPAISPLTSEGVYAVAFESRSTNLTSSFTDNNGVQDIFVRFPNELKTLLVSLGEGGLQGDGPSFSPSVVIAPNPETLLVAFSSDATNLVPGDTNGRRDIFLSSLPVSDISSANPLASLTLRGTANQVPAPDGDSDEPRLSGNGQRLVFASTATNLIPGQPLSGRHIYLVDQNLTSPVLVSKLPDGTPGNGSVRAPSISFSGRFVSFITNSTNLTSDNSAGVDIAVRVDTFTGAIRRIDTAADGTPGDSPVLDSRISASGRFATFSSAATTLSTIAGGRANVYVKDLESGELIQISRSQSGGAVDADSGSGVLISSSFKSLSPQVVFASRGTNITSDTPTGNVDLYAVTLAAGATPINKGTRIEVPPDVLVTAVSETKRTISLTLQEFSTSAALVAGLRDAQGRDAETSAARPRKRVVYDVRLTSDSGRKRDNRAKLSRRNQVAFRGVKPGTYSARYRAMVMRGEKVISRTPFSPRRRFTA